MANQESSYRQIFKTTSIFGGVQVFSILISIIKSKVIAILLGPAGIGLYGVLNSTIEVLKSITGFGLGVSAVKEVSEAAATEETTRISHILKTLRRWVYATGIFGFLLTLLLAPQLSQWTFGDESYTWAFRWLSVVLFFSALSSGQTAALQGMRQVAYMAKATMCGAFLGLCVSIPMYYWLGYQGIVASIIISSISTLIFSSLFARRIKQVTVQQSYKETFKQGIGMAKLGLAMMFNSVLTLLVTYAIKAYISRVGGIDDAGIYQSAFAIAEGYFGLMFAAMIVDYYPRLAAINQDNRLLGNEVNKQAEVGLLIAFPCIIIALFFMPIGIRLLYTKEFMSSVKCINWAMLGNLFKIGSWAMGYVLIAKGKSKLFATTGVVFNSIYLLISIYGYRLYGIEGIGMAFFIYYIIHFAGVFLICSYLFKIHYKMEFLYLFVIILSISIIAFFLQGLANPWIKYSTAFVLSILSLYISYRQLDKRLDIKEFINNKLRRK